MSNPILESRVKAKLKSREQRGILRRLGGTSKLHQVRSDNGIERFGKADFSSSDYLSLASSDALRERFLDALKQHPSSQNGSAGILGSGGSRLLDGNSPVHAALEAGLEEFFNAPSALIFNSGYDANVGLFSSVPQAGDVILYDSLIHASVHDGMRASRVHPSMCRKFKHNSVSDLRSQIEEILRTCPSIRDGKACVFIAVESLYSMDGDFAPLHEIVTLAEEQFPFQNAHVIVDEAHSTGIYGENGKGIVSLLRLEHRVLVRLHTFGKALASAGAVIMTTPWLREYLINYARPFMYTTSLPIYHIIAMQCVIDMLREGAVQNRIDHLLHLSSYFVRTLRSRLNSIPDSESIIVLPDQTHTCNDHIYSPGQPSNMVTASLVSPIIPLLTPSSNPRHWPDALARFLQTGEMDPSATPSSHQMKGVGTLDYTAKRRYLAYDITPPIVPRAASRVRICMHAGNTKDEVDGLIEAIVYWVNSVLVHGPGTPQEQSHEVSGESMPEGQIVARSKL
ncbi:pyridoxal phosphate-dependent transferase [Cantharellus anzutake]|uniref:pyridoxal phosphate-dependent transferase n=1 Tax=Cantharellus anzutake TaxID=1750568 RepID=UPI001908C9E3|nr:pyridoxal phosphate-dependent transferase [Cantharellus anzutake]KAF8336243.1 pyridoxal phosphate-dependent transferase [Cantharellus anzutake]